MISSRRATSTLGKIGLGALVALSAACGSAAPQEHEALGTTSEALVAVGPPSFSVPNVSFYCSATWNDGGSALWENAQQDWGTNTCGWALGAARVNTGLITYDNWNIAEERCDPNYYWIAETWGGSALAVVNGAASSTQTGGHCLAKVTVGPSLRQNESSGGVVDYWATPGIYATPNGIGAPSHGGKAFNANVFRNEVAFGLSVLTPAGYTKPVGYQLVLRKPMTSPGTVDTDLLVDDAHGSVVGYKPLPSGNYPIANSGTSAAMANIPMTIGRRFDSASIGKTITAVAMVAAFDDLEKYGNDLGVTLESRVAPYLQSIGWTIDDSVKPITFRDLLRHSTPLCVNNRPEGDDYATLKALMAYKPAEPDPIWKPGPTSSEPGIRKYCNNNFALMRILLPLVVEGQQAFFGPNGLKSDDQIDKISSLAYRNFVKGRVFDPIGLTDVDDRYTGPLPETLYFGKDGVAIPDQINVGVGAKWGYDLRSNTTVRSAGSGFWYLSAREYAYFVANLWAGKIVSTSALQKMLSRYPLSLEIGYEPKTNNFTWGKNGAGSWGGPWTQWVTFADGTTAVLLSNSPAGASAFRTILETAYIDAWK